MDLLLVAALALALAWTFKSRAERARVARLATHLRQYDIEKLMGTLSEGYLRAIGEEDAQRRQAIWALLEPSERKICEQFGQFAQRFGQENEVDSRVLRPAWPVSAVLLWLQPVFPRLLERHSFDMRRLLALHAQALEQAVQANALPASQKAFTLLAELMLMQHSCHWFCKSRPVASARLLVRHQTPYAKVLGSVAPNTLEAYQALTGVP